MWGSFWSFESLKSDSKTFHQWHSMNPSSHTQHGWHAPHQVGNSTCLAFLQFLPLYMADHSISYICNRRHLFLVQSHLSFQISFTLKHTLEPHYHQQHGHHLEGASYMQYLCPNQTYC